MGITSSSRGFNCFNEGAADVGIFWSRGSSAPWIAVAVLVVQLKQMIPALPFSSPPRKRGSRAASLVPAGLEPALSRP
jgi:hypothetical protein